MKKRRTVEAVRERERERATLKEKWSFARYSDTYNTV